MEVVQGLLQIEWRTVFQCCNLRSRSILFEVLLHALGLLLGISGIFRFHISFHPFELLYLLLLFNWIVCILFECVAAEIVFQIPWHHLKLQNVTLLRYSVFLIMLTMGLINVYSMWELCMEVHNSVLGRPEYSWIESWILLAPPLWLAISTAMFHAILIAICIPVQVIIVTLECNKNIPNINFRSHIMLAVNLWLFVHFVHLDINYSHYNAIALFYRLCCTIWMFLYCYPVQTYNMYHWFKRQLPDWIRQFLRSVRDKLIPKVWRNFRAVIERRTREEIIVVDNTRNQWSVLWMALCNKPKALLLSLHVIHCTLLSWLVKYYTGWDLTFLTPTLLLYLILRHNFCEEFDDIVSQLRSTAADYSSCFISHSDTNSFHGAVERFEMKLPIECTEFEFSGDD